ncbi:MAG: helix-turn-helix domain-containing protein, partial [Actinomycetota bacterium]|nr:helix-turn-helix domain-containing protein [Actinomycetota bacterium]
MVALHDALGRDHRLAEYLGASTSFVYRLTVGHRIPFLARAKVLRFRPEDVARHLGAESAPPPLSALRSSGAPSPWAGSWVLG